MLEDALEHVVRERCNWIFFLSETDGQHFVAGDLAGFLDMLMLTEKCIVFFLLVLLLHLLKFAGLLVPRETCCPVLVTQYPIIVPERHGVLFGRETLAEFASVVNACVFLHPSVHMFFHFAAWYIRFRPKTAKVARPKSHWFATWQLCTGT